MSQNEWGEDLLDLRYLLEKEDDILTGNGTDPEEDILYLRRMRELRDNLWTDLNDYADNESVLVHENYFTDYAQDFADSLYGIETSWPYNHIDWNEAAEELKMDYTEVEVAGDIYYIRSY